MSAVNHGIDRVGARFDDESLVADAGLLLTATLAARLGLEALVDATVRLVDRVGGARPGRKVLTLVHAMVAGADCIDDTNRLRAGSSGEEIRSIVERMRGIVTILDSATRVYEAAQLTVLYDHENRRAKIRTGPRSSGRGVEF